MTEGLTVSATATAPPSVAVPTPPQARTQDIPGKVKWMHWSEVIDSLRLFPRLIIIPMFVWAAWKLGGMLDWYMWHLTTAERTGNVTAFAGVITTPICTVLGYAFKVYIGGGRDWDKQGGDDVRDHQ